MSYTLEEIRRQPQDWAMTLRQMEGQAERWRQTFRDRGYENVYFTGCGTSYYISIAAAYVFQEITGIHTSAHPASEVMLMPEKLFDRKQRNLLIGVGRSGATTESVEAIRRFREDGYGDALSIACRTSAPASAVATYAIELGHVVEHSIVMTGTFTNLLLAAQVLAGMVSGNVDYLAHLRQLPEAGACVLDKSDDVAQTYGRDLGIQRVIYLGLGGYYGIASEAVLKLKEMTQTATEAYNPLEFRHGPISMVEKGTLVVLFRSDVAPQLQTDVLRDVRGLGGRALLVSDLASGEPESLAINAGLPDTARGILYAPFAQLTAYHRAVALGLDPDKPRNLSQVVTLQV
ncbi:MAG: SIS domain-containing protein [Alicyclobacillus sp.]|nr:SIS domain-containing protein [Alicyclobacillus sp.]